MPCFVAFLALFFPRIAIILVWLFSTYLQTANQTVIWPVIGFFFMPLTTLAYAFAWHQGGGSIQGFGLIVLIIAILMDVGVIGGSAKSRKLKARQAH